MKPAHSQRNGIPAQFVRRLPSVLAAVMALVLTGSAAAQPLADRVPGDAVLYVGWRGADALGESMKGSHLQGVLEKSGIPELVDRAIPAGREWLEAAWVGDPRVSPKLEALPSAMWARPWAFAVLPEGPDDSPRVGLLMEPGERAAAVRRAFEAIVAGAGPARAEAPRLVERGELLGLVTGDADHETTLADAKRFRKMMGRFPAGRALVGWCDVASVLELGKEEADAVPAQVNPAKAAQQLGLDAINGVALAGGLDGRRWRSDVFVTTDGRSEGLFELFAGPPIDEALLREVPSAATHVSAFRTDLSVLPDLVRDFLDARQGASPALADRWLGIGQAMTGIDLESQLLDALGPRWLFYTDPAVAGPSGLGLVAVNPLRKPDALRGGLERLEERANAMLLQQQKKSRGETRWRIVSEKHDGVTLHSALLPLISPTWAIHEGRLYAGLLPQAVKRAIEEHEGSILDDGEFTALHADALADGGVASISYVDLEATAPMVYQGHLMWSQMLPAASVMLGAEGPAMLLPPLGELMPHLAPAGSVSVTDGDGWHWRSSTPFPGSTLFGQSAWTGAGLSQASLTAGVLLPALGAARRTAEQMESMTQARGILQSCMVYARSNDNEFPSSLSALVHGNYLGPEYLMSPGAPQKLPDDFDDWGKRRQSEWIGDHASYVLIPGLKGKPDPEKVVVFAKPSHSPGEKIAVGFQDGHAEQLPIEEAKRRIEKQTGRSFGELVGTGGSNARTDR